MTIYKRAANGLSEDELALCYEHNLGSEGEMRTVLEGCIAEKRSAIVYMMYEGADFVGWAILYDEWLGDYSGKTTTHVFIRDDYRRLGYGSRLLSEVAGDNPMTKVYTQPHDLRSYRFYAQHLDKVSFDLIESMYVLPKPEFDSIAGKMVQ